MRSVSDVFWFWEKRFVSGRICKVATDEVAQNQRKFNRFFQERVRIQLWKGENYLGSSPMAPSNDHLPGRKNFEKGRSTSGRTLGRPWRGDLSYSKKQTGNFINHVMFQVKKKKFKNPHFVVGVVCGLILTLMSKRSENWGEQSVGKTIKKNSFFCQFETIQCVQVCFCLYIR